MYEGKESYVWNYFTLSHVYKTLHMFIHMYKQLYHAKNSL